MRDRKEPSGLHNTKRNRTVRRPAVVAGGALGEHDRVSLVGRLTDLGVGLVVGHRRALPVVTKTDLEGPGRREATTQHSSNLSPGRTYELDHGPVGRTSPELAQVRWVGQSDRQSGSHCLSPMRSLCQQQCELQRSPQ